MGKKKKLDSTTILGATFIGVLIGVSIGVLFAPDKWKTPRKIFIKPGKQPLKFEIAGVKQTESPYGDDHRPPLK